MRLQRQQSDPSGRLKTALVYAALALAAGLTAYWSVFSTFTYYDDEGTLLVALRGFVAGDTLYEDVFSQYGPFYFELFGGLFALTGRTATNDAGRLIVVALWTSSTMMLAAVGHRLTGSVALGVVTAAVGFEPLRAFVAEPMHPVGLCVFLLCLLALAAVIASERRLVLSASLLGLTLAALTLTKINLGVFAVAALTVAAVVALPQLHRIRWLRIAVCGGFAVLPVALVRSDLDVEWARDLGLLAACCAAAVVVAAHAIPMPAGEDEAPARRWLLACVGAFAAGCLVCLLAIMLTGVGPVAVIEAIVIEAAQGNGIFVVPFVRGANATAWGIAALAAAVAASSAIRNGGLGDRPRLGLALLKLVVGLMLCGMVARVSLLGLNTEASSLVLPMALAWVAALPPSGAAEPLHRRILRVFLPAAAVAETLQIYPVAGAQVQAAGVLFAPLAVLCLADGLALLRERAALGERSVGADTLKIAAIGLAAVAAWSVVVRPGIAIGQNYAKLPSAQLAGMHRTHIPPEQAADYRRLTQLLRENCTQFVSFPSVNSLYLWSGLRPPRQTLPGGWMTLIGDERQARVVAELEATERPCAVRNRTLAGFWTGRDPTPEPLDGPLVKYIEERFKLTEQVRDYEFLTPK
jgi:hypothetical protein